MLSGSDGSKKDKKEQRRSVGLTPSENNAAVNQRQGKKGMFNFDKVKEFFQIVALGNDVVSQNIEKKDM